MFASTLARCVPGKVVCGPAGAGHRARWAQPQNAADIARASSIGRGLPIFPGPSSDNLPPRKIVPRIADHYLFSDFAGFTNSARYAEFAAVNESRATAAGGRRGVARGLPCDSRGCG